MLELFKTDSGEESSETKRITFRASEGTVAALKHLKEILTLPNLSAVIRKAIGVLYWVGSHYTDEKVIVAVDKRKYAEALLEKNKGGGEAYYQIIDDLFKQSIRFPNFVSYEPVEEMSELINGTAGSSILNQPGGPEDIVSREEGVEKKFASTEESCKSLEANLSNQ